jgi:hypothetical protein
MIFPDPYPDPDPRIRIHNTESSAWAIKTTGSQDGCGEEARDHRIVALSIFCNYTSLTSSTKQLALVYLGSIDGDV